MLECYKSRKAAAPGKSPRKVIDLRSCITLEVGLEYRELQHILSLGTFKKTFFFAAHSDALMLQWGDNIEKVKNALDGECVCVSDVAQHSLQPQKVFTNNLLPLVLKSARSA